MIFKLKNKNKLITNTEKSRNAEFLVNLYVEGLISVPSLVEGIIDLMNESESRALNRTKLLNQKQS